MKASAGSILIIVQNLPVPFDRRVWLEAQALKASNFNVSVICPTSKEYPKFNEQIDGIHIYRYNIPVDAHGVLGYVFEFLYAWLATALLSVKILVKHGFDVIHACNPPDTFFLLAAFYKLFGKKFVFDHHDLAPDMFKVKFTNRMKFLYKILVFLERMTLKTANKIIVTNKSYKQNAIKHGVQEKDIQIVRTGPDLRRLKVVEPNESLKNGKKFLVCYLGEMCKQDGLDYLLKSVDYIINDLKRSDVYFLCLGGGPAMPMFKDMMIKMNLENWVKFTGRVPDVFLCTALSTADVCVDPDPYSEWADSSTMNKILEYMVFAKPIVAFDLKETKFSAQQAALYAVNNDIKDFGDKIIQLVDDSDERQQMGEFGQKRVFDSLTWEHSRSKLVALYQNLFKN